MVGRECTHNEKNGQSKIYNSLSHEKIQNCNLFIMSIIHGIPVDACCWRQQSVIFVCIEQFVRTLGAKSRYFPPSALIINSLQSCMDNPQTR